MASETFRRSKLVKWLIAQIEITEHMQRVKNHFESDKVSEAFLQSRHDMIESLMREFKITNEEIKDIRCGYKLMTL